MCNMNEDIEEIVARLAEVDSNSQSMDRVCAACRKKLWVCEADVDPKRCVGRMARRVLAGRENREKSSNS